MPSKSQKGNQFQDWCAKWLAKQYPDAVIHNQKAVAKTIKMRDPKTGQLVDRWVSQRNDLFGCIDIAMIAGTRILFIQCTMDTGVGRKLAELKKVPWPLYVGVEVWVKREPGRVDVMRYTPEKTLAKVGTILRGKFQLEAF